jgi:tetratricopeptide (TPR) repeat protein
LAGRYTLREPVGEGGMGTVWEAEQTEPVRRPVAVKVIKPGMDSRSVLARFEAERQALALMDHPNIARVLDAGATPEGRPFFVMELVKGVPITRYCDDSRLTVRQRLELFVPVCRAVQHAHQKGVIHRDLKPSNVLVTAIDGAPVPKVIDFGVAKAAGQPLTERTLETGPGTVVGTPAYMSPEQAGLNRLDVDTRSDVYGLGALLYELLTGGPPFGREELERSGLLEALRAVREVEPDRPSARLAAADGLAALAASRGTEPRRLVAAVRGDLDWVVMKALEKDRDRRYDTAAALAADVRRNLADQPVLAGPPSAAYRLRKFVRRNRAAVLAVGLVLLALAGGVAGTVVGLVRARQAEAQARDDADVARTISRFFQNLLAQADVSNQPRAGGLSAGRDPNLTVRVLLDRAGEEVERAFPNREPTEAAIRMTIGDAYLALGVYPPAQRHLERAIELRTARLGPDHPDTLDARHSLGYLFYLQSRYGEAEAVIREVGDRYAAALGADHLDTLCCRHDLAVMCRERGGFEPAEALFQEVLGRLTATLGAGHHITVMCKYDLAVLAERRGDYDRSAALAREVIDDLTALAGADHPHTLLARNALAWAYHRGRKYDLAEPIYREVIAAESAKLAPDHPDTLTTRQNLAELYEEQDRYDRAEPILREVLAARVARLGPRHTQTLASKNSLGVAYFHLRRFDLSVPLFEELLRDRRQNPGDDHPATERVAFNLAANYREVGRAEDAARLIDEWLPRARARFGLGQPTTRLGVEVAMSLYEKARTPAQVEAFYHDLLRAQAAELGADDPDTLLTRDYLASLCWRTGRYKESVLLSEETLRGRQARGGDEKGTCMTAFNLAVTYRDAGRPADALRVIDEWFPRAQARLGLGHPTVKFGVYAALTTYESADAPVKAEPLLRDLAEFARQPSGAGPREYAVHLTQLGGLLLRQKKGPVAERVLRDCLASRQAQEPEAWMTFYTRSMLGEALAFQGRYADAEPLLLQGYAGMQRREATIPANARIRLTEGLGWLVQLYDAWGKPDQAARWRKELAAREQAGPKPDRPKGG